MKKLIFLTVFIFISVIGFAQVSFGVQVGGNIAFGKISYDGTAFPAVFANDPKFGVLAGFLAEIPISGKISFRPEINFVQKGSKTNTTLSIFEENSKVTLNYIEVPLNIAYKLPAGKGNFFFGLGPSVAFGVSGTNKFTNSSDPTQNKNIDVKFDGKKNTANMIDNLKAFDFGANILAGYKLHMGVFFKLGYTYNFLNIDPDDNRGYKNRGFNICAGYMIGGSKSSK